MLAALFAGVVLAGEAPRCDAVRSEAELKVALDAVEVAWGLDDEPFRAAAARVDALLPCLGQLVSPATAAQVHRVRGLVAYYQQDEPRACAAFVAARALDPAYTFPERMVPEKSPLRTLYTCVPSPAAPRRAPAPKPPLRLYVDGAPAPGRIPDRAAFVQVLGDPAASTNTWLLPTDPLPAYPERDAHASRTLAVVAGGLALGGLGALALNQDWKHRVWPESTSATEDLNFAIVNGTGGAVIGLGAAALGTGVAALAVGRW